MDQKLKKKTPAKKLKLEDSKNTGISEVQENAKLTLLPLLTQTLCQLRYEAKTRRMWTAVWGLTEGVGGGHVRGSNGGKLEEM